jgi:tetratricopeptide (TPR) repeat protein
MHRALLLIPLLVALATPVLAQGSDDDARARELYENGAMLYEEGRYEDAIKAWQEAYRISERPLLWFNIANAQERVGRWRDALESLNAYRAFATADEREVLDRRMRNIERRVKEQEDADAEREAEEAEEAEKARREEDVRAEAAAAAAEEEVPPPDTSPKAADAPPLVGIGAGLLVGGLVGAGVGGGLSGAALSKRGEIEAACKSVGETLFCPQTVEPLEAEEVQLSLGGDIALIAGGAVAGTGLVLMIVDLATGNKKAAYVVPTFGGIAVAGRF